jgi:hypothetical protein
MTPGHGAHKQAVRMDIAVLNGRAKAGFVRAEPEIAMVASDEFWMPNPRFPSRLGRPR